MSTLRITVDASKSRREKVLRYLDETIRDSMVFLERDEEHEVKAFLADVRDAVKARHEQLASPGREALENFGDPDWRPE